MQAPSFWLKLSPTWRSILTYLGIVALFALVATAYFTPATFEGRVLFQVDGAGASGTAQDVRDWEEATGERSYWTRSLFGGMPTYQISPSYPSTEPLSLVDRLYTQRGWLLGSYPWMLFSLMIGFFIFLRSLDVRKGYALFGALLWAFSSYFAILIQAGHIWKLMALAYIPPTIAGMIWIYRNKLWLGGTTLALFTALQILANHVQMTYYFLFVMAGLFIGFLVKAAKEHSWKPFLRQTGVLLLAGLVGISANLTNLYHTYQYGQETMRGGSELTLPKPGDNTPSETNAQGLEKAYITQWSYGIGETWSLLVPNVRGGASEPFAQHPKLLHKVSPYLQSSIAGAGTYWGNQPFTSGPVYVGAFVCCLFLLGCFLVKGPTKWVLLGCTLLSILLSWGKNFMPLTSFFIDYFPLYSKFRSVSSILVIAEFTIPTLAILGLLAWMKDPGVLRRKSYIAIIAFGLPMAALLLMALFPSLFGSFLSVQEQQFFSQMATQDPIYTQLANELIAVRKSMLTGDAWRGLLIVVLSLAALYSFAKGWLRRSYALLLVGLFSTVDLWTVAKRYLHDDMFQPESAQVAKSKEPSAADKEILQQRQAGAEGRVLNLSVSPFNDATTSRFHESVGGYHAAKLQRYQELIDYQIMPGNRQVLAMLNTRFEIHPQENGSLAVVENPLAMGWAWLTPRIRIVPNANTEMAALGEIDLSEETVIRQSEVTDEVSALTHTTVSDSTAYIRSLERTPNSGRYKAFSSNPTLAVFSDMYYPHGWHATINGTPAHILRANYTLQALVLPAGESEIEISFRPDSITRTETISWIVQGLAMAALLATAILAFLKKRKSTKSIA